MFLVKRIAGVGVAILVTVIVFSFGTLRKAWKVMGGAVANRIICNIFLYGKHGDDSDMMFLSIASMDGLKKAAGLGGAQLPPFATFPYCNHGDDMMLHFYSRHGWLRKKQGWGGRGVELASQHLLVVFIRA